MTVLDRTAYDSSATHLQCALCGNTVPADTVESSPAGCGIDRACGDCMTDHIRDCGWCAAECMGDDL